MLLPGDSRRLLLIGMSVSSRPRCRTLVASGCLLLCHVQLYLTAAYQLDRHHPPRTGEISKPGQILHVLDYDMEHEWEDVPINGALTSALISWLYNLRNRLTCTINQPIGNSFTVYFFAATSYS